MNISMAVATVLTFICQLLLIAITYWDLREQLIYRRHLLPLALCGLIATLLSAPEGQLMARAFDSLLAAAAGFLSFLLLAVLTGGGIGGGDIKLMGALGLWLGTEKLLTVALAGCLLGGLFALFALLTGRKKRGEAIPYAPGFTLAALAVSLATCCTR